MGSEAVPIARKARKKVPQTARMRRKVVWMAGAVQVTTDRLLRKKALTRPTWKPAVAGRRKVALNTELVMVSRRKVPALEVAIRLLATTEIYLIYSGVR
jgi:hypothetical protein